MEENELKVKDYDVPEDLLYTKDHEWVRLEAEEAVVGITHYAAEMLHDVVFVTLPSLGAKVEAGKAVANVESVKSVSDVFSPLSGVVTSVNQELTQHPELINQDPYGRGWFFRAKLTSLEAERGGLMDPSSYAKLLEELVAQEG